MEGVRAAGNKGKDNNSTIIVSVVEHLVKKIHSYVHACYILAGVQVCLGYQKHFSLLT